MTSFFPALLSVSGTKLLTHYDITTLCLKNRARNIRLCLITLADLWTNVNNSFTSAFWGEVQKIYQRTWNMLSHYLGKIGILDNMFHCKCMKINVLFFIWILPSYGCYGNGWISWFSVSTVTSQILYCVIGWTTNFYSVEIKCYWTILFV